mmetsp:Transcript_35548/g.83256  ORF Transcript_35548/g.83256 Transcript_35548/m.83256 type:complete len:353 (-) Transcript_35548:306-1364(-)
MSSERDEVAARGSGESASAGSPFAATARSSGEDSSRGSSRCVERLGGVQKITRGMSSNVLQASFAHAQGLNLSTIKEIGSNFWQVRADFKILKGMFNLKTHMCIVRLSEGPSKGRFVILSAVTLTKLIKKDLDLLTKSGQLIEAVIGTHPFHTLAFRSFYDEYPNAKYYGTPRHLRVLKEIPWAGETLENKDLWSGDLDMRIPAGSEYDDPKPPHSNHLSNVIVYHAASRSIFVDDTLLCIESPGMVLRLLGFKAGKLFFHPSIKGPGLHPSPEAPQDFKKFVYQVLEEWQFDNICCAHTGNVLGDGREKLAELIRATEPLLDKLSQRNRNLKSPPKDCGQIDPSATTPECG